MRKSTFFVMNLLIVLAIIFIPVTTFAADKVKNWDELVQDADAFINKGKEKDIINSSDVATTIMPIAQALVAVAAGVLVVVTCIMGVKYATTTSAEAQAKLKKQLVGLVVSIVVVFGAHAIWTIVYNFMKDLFLKIKYIKGCRTRTKEE